jgi:ring-1,2-phenylacetyl-CoA epoxidase subunit PaaB
MTTDTQWPRYYVFEQPDDDRPLIHAGSVHASDREMALLTARDVFGRRPKRTTMWVVRDQDIFARTSEELEDYQAVESETSDKSKMLYQLFIKRSHKGVCVWAGELEAFTYENALDIALKKFADMKPLLLWIIRDADIVKTDPADQEMLYESSPGKKYRHESDYPVRTMMMELKNKKKSKKE